MKKKHILELIAILQQIKPIMKAENFTTLSVLLAGFLSKYNPGFNQNRFFKSI